MKALRRLVSVVHALMAVLFAISALLLVMIASRMAWDAVAAGIDRISSKCRWFHSV